MTVRAMSLRHLVDDLLSTPDVLLVADRFKVRYLYAVLEPTPTSDYVVQLQSFRNRSSDSLVEDYVGVALAADTPVSLWRMGSLPAQAPRLLVSDRRRVVLGLFEDPGSSYMAMDEAEGVTLPDALLPIGVASPGYGLATTTFAGLHGP
jgi:hypothetical protein